MPSSTNRIGVAHTVLEYKARVEIKVARSVLDVTLALLVIRPSLVSRPCPKFAQAEGPVH